ncbi:MAG: helix-turn-helix domain-containing protein [Clostridiales bacterium]|nr:helix-turn-helix domain-containing protein [Clostridiales bacterium]
MHPTKDIRSLIQHLFAEFVTADSYSETLFNNYLQIFYANIIRCSENQYDASLPRKQAASHTLMPAILSYIRQNYHTLSLSALAAHFHYDSAYLSRLIREATGKNYREMITELKISEAKELLALTDRSMEEIAETVGYSGPDHFGYTFRKATGMSPRQYRTQNKPGKKMEL